MEQGMLYIVATPIGNLGDMTPRAVETLAQVDLIAAEDTRHSGRLLQHFAIDTPCVAYHEHNERQFSAKLVTRMLGGERIALISDAGTPLVSDPGYHLVRSTREAGVQVIPIPGACALVSALATSGLPSDRFVFEGFLPAKQGARCQRLQQLERETRTLIFYESPHRIVDAINDMEKVFGGQRQAVIGRELSKRFETIHGDTLAGLVVWLAADSDQQRGEFVVVVRGAEVVSSDFDVEAERVLRLLMAELPLKQAAALAAKITGVKKNRLYKEGLVLGD